MAVTQDAVLAALLAEGGKIKNSELLIKFKDPLNCSDPTEKKQNRELFKTIINTLAVVKEFEEVKHIVLRKKFQHLLKLSSEEENGEEQKDEGGDEEQEKVGLKPTVEEQQQREMCENETPPEENKPEKNVPSDGESSHCSPAPSFIELALQRQKSADFKVKKSLHFVMPLKPGTDNTEKHGPACSTNTSTSETSTHKRFALPLRVPPVAVTPVAQEGKIKIPSNDNNPVQPHLAPPVSAMPGPPYSPRYKRHSSADSVGIGSSPQPRRHCKSVKPVEEPRYSDTIPLDISEHQWMVMSASGHWALVYGLLLNDAQLAEKKDFISGFTALHWAAKSGNSNMLCKIIDLSRKNGKGVDINAKSYAGYTPLHVAAIHSQEYIIGILVNEYGANCHIRDNSGKKPHHYLDQGASHSIRELLGGVKVVRSEPQRNTDDTDTHKHSHTISRLFQPQTIGYKKKPKSRNTFLSMAEDTKDTKDEKGEQSNPTHRAFSDVFS